MTTRPSRSASIPIPRSASAVSPSRNIESVISIPFATPGRHPPSAQSIPQRHSIADDRRGASASYGPRGSSGSAIATSPTRSTSRSMTYTGASHVRGLPRATSTFEPRIVRATTDSSRGVDAACFPSSSTSPSRTRRSSVANSRAASSQRPVSSHTISIPPPPPVSFARPAYLEHSALRHMLQTELPPALPPSRKTDTSTPDHHGYSAAMSPPTDSDEDSNVSPPREFPSAQPLPPIPQDQILRLPTRWSDQFRHALLTVSGDGRDLNYHGASCSGDRDAAAARTIHPIPPACGIYYYEVDILSKGQKGHISIGFAARHVRLSRLPGWESNSWGYHGDDGYSFAAEKSGTPFGPTFGTGDIIGCGIDFTTHKAFFTKNGTLIGSVFDNVGKDVELYPSVGLRHSGEAIRVNFGHEPFKYDIDYHVQQARNHTWANILRTPLNSSLLANLSQGQANAVKQDTTPSSTKTSPTDEQTKGMINKLVMAYLAHHGYIKTVRAFQQQEKIFCGEATRVPDSSSQDRDVDMVERSESEDMESDIERRTNVVNSVISGDIDTALFDTKAHYPSVLDAEEGLMLFKLRCRKFVELILEASELKKKMKSQVQDDEAIEEMDGIYEDGMGMDVDDEGSSINGFGGTSNHQGISLPPGDPVWPGSTASQYETALNQAIAYGQTLSNDYKADSRSQVREIFKRTFAIVAWEDPMTTGGLVSEVVGHEARVTLASELNQAILKSQGRPPQPALETLYRYTAATVEQLGLLGVGSAAFADMPKEFLNE